MSSLEASGLWKIFFHRDPKSGLPDDKSITNRANRRATIRAGFPIRPDIRPREVVAAVILRADETRSAPRARE